MYSLEVVERKSELVHESINFLRNSKVNLIVSHHIDDDLSNENGIDLISYYLTEFNRCEINFAGASHGNVIGPLFSLHKLQDSILKIHTYISYYKQIEIKKIQDEITMLSIAVSVYYPKINKIILPPIIDEFKNEECTVNKLNNTLEITLKN